MKSILSIVTVLLIMASCNEKKPVAGSKVLMEADSAFSGYSVRNGLQKAFVAFAHDSVVLLKPGRLPIEGKQRLIDSYQGRSDSSILLTWKPVKAIIAESGELGYTYGIWTFIAANDTSKGTYLTIWKRNAKGEWKYIADTGNEGIGK